MRQQNARQHFAGQVKMAQVSSRVTTTDAARATLIQRSRVARPLRVLHVELAARGEGLSGSSISCRQHAIKHIHAARHTLNQIFRRPNTHQIARTIRRHPRRNLFNHAVHHTLLFTDTQAAERVAIETNFNRARQTLTPQLKMRRALDNSEQRLFTA